MNTRANKHPLIHGIGGGLGAMLGAIVTSPLEVVKTRLQASQNKQLLQSSFKWGTGTLASIRTLAQQEGIGGLYRGLGTQLAGVIPARSIHFLVYGWTKSYLARRLNKEYDWWIPTISSAVAGATVVTITQPIWLVKTRLQLQTLSVKETLYSSPMDALRKTYQKEGIKGLYRGMGASYLGLSETVLQFTIYEYFKKQKLNEFAYSSSNFNFIMDSLVLSSVSKLIASSLTYPHEVVRTRLREQKSNLKYKGPFQGLYVIAKEEGVRGLYGGMGAHLLRVVPNAAVMFMTYELTLKYLG